MQVQADTIKRKKMEYRKKLIIISYLSNILYTKMTCNDTLEFYHKNHYYSKWNAILVPVPTNADLSVSPYVRWKSFP